MLSRASASSVKKFFELVSDKKVEFKKDIESSNEIEIVINNNLNKERVDFDRELYKFVRQYVTNYYTNDPNKRIKETLLEYRTRNNDELENKVTQELNSGDAMLKVKQNGRTNTIINIVMFEADESGESIFYDPIRIDIPDNIINTLKESKNQDTIKMEINKITSEMSYECQMKKMAYEMIKGLRHNALPLIENLNNIDEKLKEEAYYIIGKDENIRNGLTRLATLKGIEKEATTTFKLANTRKQKENLLDHYSGVLERIYGEKEAEKPENRNLKNDELEKITRIRHKGFKYDISTQETIIAQHPELLDVYPALKFRFEYPDGYRRTIADEVEYGLNKINNMIENSDLINGNKEALEGKTNQVLDLLNEDFEYQMSGSENVEEDMKFFITSLGKDKSKMFLTQFQKWQESKEKIRQKEEKELEKDIDSYELYSSAKDRNDKEYVSKVEKFKNDLKMRTLSKYKRLYVVEIDRDKNTNVSYVEKEDKTKPKNKVNTRVYLENIDEYSIPQTEEYNELKENENIKKKLKNRDAKLLYSKEIEKAKEKAPLLVQERESEFCKKVKEQSNRNKKAEEKAKREEKNSKSTSKSTLKTSKAAKENHKDKKDLNDENIKKKVANEQTQKAEKSEIEINKYENKNKDKNIIEENELQLEIEGMPDGRIKNIPVDYSDENKGELKGKIEEPFKPISTEEDQFTIEEYENSKNSLSKKRIQEYVGNKESIKKVTGINEHQVEVAKTKRQKREYERIKETKDPKAIASYIENNEELRKYLIDKNLLKFYEQEKEKIIEEILSTTPEQNHPKLDEKYKELDELNGKIAKSEVLKQQIDDYTKKYKRKLNNKEKEDTPER